MYIQRFAEDSHIIGVIGVRFSKDHIFKGQIPNLRILHIRDERALPVLEACHINIFCQPIISLIIIKGRQPVVNPLPQSSTSA